jgi:putative ABC transport system permease protein
VKGFVNPVFTEQVLARVQTLPGVRSAAIASVMPMLQERGMDAPMFIRGRPEPAKPQDIIRASVRIVSNNFLNTMGMRLLRGRNLDDRDGAGRPPVVLVNKTFVSNYFRNEQVVGNTLRIGQGGSLPPVEIVGVVDDVQYEDLGPVPASEIYLNVQQASNFLPPVPPPPGVPEGAFPRRTWTAGPMVFALRTIGDPAKEAARIRGIVAEVNSQLIMDDIATMDQRLSVYVVRPHFYAILMGVFSLIAITLAAIGIYGVVGYSVSQRTREIGIRIAVGAGQRAILQFVLRQSLVLITVGIGVGILGAFTFTRYLETLLFGLTPTDPATFIFAVGFTSLIAGLASYVPARRATKVDPAIALRHE